MAYRHYNRLLYMYVLAIVIIAAAVGYLAAVNKSLFLVVILCCAEFFCILAFIRMLNSTNEQINYFIQAIKNEDTLLRFPVKNGSKIVDELHKSLNELNVVLQQTKLKNQVRERYFSEILQNIATGVVVVNEKGFITDVNRAALDLLGLSTFTHVMQLERVDKRFKEDFVKVGNQQQQMLFLRRGNETVQLVTRCSEIVVKDERVKLLTLQDIRGELEKKEIDAWVKLIRVLSHEIMNSLTPVTSIAQSLKGIWKKRVETSDAFLNDDDVESTISGLDVIGERGEALIRFVRSYRVLTRVPEPNLQPISIRSFFDRLTILVSPLREELNGNVMFKSPENDFHFYADEQMMVHVVVNLVKNALEALAGDGNGKVEVEAKNSGGNTEIFVKDNGQGVPDEIKDEIFIPFFTTKENGSGIGLSYSRQILRAHGGSLSCRSKPGETVFVLKW
ncbi:MAG: PAS domain-containing protein [Prolixibacteraceae bacterium]|nr:PAS domain-containing protein [Prolixibacteraceae bacterium]